MGEEKYVQELSNSELVTIQSVCDTLRNYENRIKTHLADFVAALCGVDVDTMLSNDAHDYIVQARGLYWYACRYMTNESYEKIALATQYNGFKFSPSCVAKNVAKMMIIIEQEPMWKKRWVIIKRILKLQDKSNNDEDTTIVVQIPKDLKNKVNIIIKDK